MVYTLNNGTKNFFTQIEECVILELNILNSFKTKNGLQVLLVNRVKNEYCYVVIDSESIKQDQNCFVSNLMPIELEQLELFVE